MSKYPPLFKRINFSSEFSGHNLHKIQNEFEQLWKSINRFIPANSEKTLGMRKMQEACMWFTRAVAVGEFNKDIAKEGENAKESVPLCAPATSVLPEVRSLNGDAKTKVITKKKRFVQATLPLQD